MIITNPKLVSPRCMHTISEAEGTTYFNVTPIIKKTNIKIAPNCSVVKYSVSVIKLVYVKLEGGHKSARAKTCAFVDPVGITFQFRAPFSHS